jgi:hypothetical protein
MSGRTPTVYELLNEFITLQSRSLNTLERTCEHIQMCKRQGLDHGEYIQMAHGLIGCMVRVGIAVDKRIALECAGEESPGSSTHSTK